jgi:hypothetical protein
VRASFDERTIRVYQAFRPEIAEPALAAQTFQAPFSRGRMTWIKPSFAWMMHRSSFASAPGQERVLGIDVLRTGFEWALAHACVSHFDPAIHENPEAWEVSLRASPVRIQWDPERTVQREKLPWRTIQMGLRGEAVHRYVDAWIVAIEDLTTIAREIEAALRQRDVVRALDRVPAELPYTLTPELARRIGADC